MDFNAELANLAIKYSINVKPDDVVLINSPETASDLIKELYIQILKAGGHPLVYLHIDELEEIKFEYSNEKQLKFFDPALTTYIEQVNKIVNVRTSSNVRNLEQIDSEKIRLFQTSRENKLYKKRFFERFSNADLKRVVIPYPCHSFAQNAEMGFYSYRKFLRSALMLDGNSMQKWENLEKKQEIIILKLKNTEKIRIIGEKTDLSLSVKGRKWINCGGRVNLPDGEILTGPVENSANGIIQFSFPGIYMGKEVEGICLEFKEGKVTKSKADKGEALLKTILSIEGADRIGEFAIGNNYSIQKFTKNTLLDEKIGGTIHIALGQGITEAGSIQKSVIHWDIVKDMRTKDAKIFADDKLIYQAGKWKI